MEILSAPAQIDNWIADQLPGTVIGRLAAAINRKKRMRQMRRVHQARLVRRPANRVNRLMFEQKQLVDSVSILPLFRDQFFLERYFFFSSRRRHTISLRDWSSDVCSSD